MSFAGRKVSLVFQQFHRNIFEGKISFTEIYDLFIETFINAHASDFSANKKFGKVTLFILDERVNNRACFII